MRTGLKVLRSLLGGMFVGVIIVGVVRLLIFDLTPCDVKYEIGASVYVQGNRFIVEHYISGCKYRIAYPSGHNFRDLHISKMSLTKGLKRND